MKRTILLYCFVCVTIGLFGQRRYNMNENSDYNLNKVSGFTAKEVENATDAKMGLHTNQYAGSHHLLGLSVDGAWSAFINSVPQAANLPGGMALGANFLYEYQYSGLLVQTGIGFHYQNVANNISDTSLYHYHMHDTWQGTNDVEFTLKHDFYRRQDQAQQIYGQVPLYVGHYIVGSHGIGYFLAGLNFNYAFWGSTRVQLEGSTMGFYEKYLGVWREMDNHGFRKDVPVERKHNRLNLKFDLAAHAEIGYEITSYQGTNSYRSTPLGDADIRFRFAGFIDFSVLDINPQQKNSLYDIPTATIYDFPTYEMYHIFSTSDANRYWQRNLNVGVRLTVLFGFPANEKCILCDPWKNY